MIIPIIQYCITAIIFSISLHERTPQPPLPNKKLVVITVYKSDIYTIYTENLK